jgi:nitrite reductase (NO-forming)
MHWSTNMRKPLIGFVVFVAVLFAGVAVVQGQGATSTPGAGSPCASPVASPKAAMTMTAAASPSAATPAACGSPVASGGGSAVSLEDIVFDPKELTIAANTDVTISLSNKGVTIHNFNIDELNIHSGDVAPGASGSVKINAKPGDYQYYCNIPGHKAAGMVGILHVK